MKDTLIQLPDDLRAARNAGQPIVALESTVISHGLPYPHNLDLAFAMEDEVRAAGAIPATVGVVEGRPTVGMSRAQIERFAQAKNILKLSRRDIAYAVAMRRDGATTVAATMALAALAGIKVLATGGIGGVHRGASESFDISADLTALSQIPIICVCAGAKAILDLPKTLEYLETLGVPVVGFQTDEFPAFYSRHSGLQLEAIAQSADEAATLAACHWRTGANTAVLVCVPVPKAFEIPASEVESAVTEAMRLAEAQDIRGKVVTPFLLAKMKELTGGNTLKANRALLLNNAAVAGQIAASLSRLG